MDLLTGADYVVPLANCGGFWVMGNVGELPKTRALPKPPKRTAKAAKPLKGPAFDPFDEDALAELALA